MIACVFTLGCKMNEVESASLQKGLEELGYLTVNELGYADLYLLNTCAVTAEAEKKSRQAIARMRKYNPDAPVVVIGCASEKNAAAFSEKEGVTLVAGAQKKADVLKRLQEKGIIKQTESVFCELPYPKQVKTRAFLRIQDGCNRFCSYCIIPYLRGRTRSRSIESILSEARQITAREIVLTGIDISSYQDGQNNLGDLLIALAGTAERIRLGSLEAGIVTRSFLEKAKAANNVMPQFHLSLQSGSNSVLRAMNRHYTREEYLEKCRLIYEYFPHAAITTDIIVGYPTETEADFEDSLRIIKEAGFSRVHCFPFSKREGTRAARLPDLSAAVKKARMEKILAAEAEAEEVYIQKFLGREAVVLYEDGGGYTENYLRVEFDGEEGALYRVKLVTYQNKKIGANVIERI